MSQVLMGTRCSLGSGVAQSHSELSCGSLTAYRMPALSEAAPADAVPARAVDTGAEGCSLGGRVTGEIS